MFTEIVLILMYIWYFFSVPLILILGFWLWFSPSFPVYLLFLLTMPFAWTCAGDMQTGLN